jgi:hypothetical protein
MLSIKNRFVAIAARGVITLLAVGTFSCRAGGGGVNAGVSAQDVPLQFMQLLLSGDSTKAYTLTVGRDSLRWSLGDPPTIWEALLESWRQGHAFAATDEFTPGVMAVSFRISSRSSSGCAESARDRLTFALRRMRDAWVIVGVGLNPC